VLAVRELKESHEPGAPDTRRYAVEVDLRFRKVIAMDGGRLDTVHEAGPRKGAGCFVV
jgi:hypothetical protein